MTTTTEVEHVDLLIEESFETYHENRKTNLSSHALGDFRKSPLLYHQKKTGVIPAKDTAAYSVGRAAHTLILEGPQVFDDTFAIGGPINPTTKKEYGSQTKKYAEWLVEQGKPAVTTEEFKMICEMKKSVNRHEIATQILAKGQAEGVARAKYMGIDCQVRPDWLHPIKGILDVKTTEDIRWFEYDAGKKYKYIHQMAFYREVIRIVRGEQYPVYFLAVEKKPPYICGVWLIDESVLSIAKEENEVAMKRFKECMEIDTWPTGYEELITFDKVY